MVLLVNFLEVLVGGDSSRRWGSKRGYLFFVEMEAHETDAPLRRAIASLGKKALRLEILGSFPASTPVE
jgi:prephenate dehydratase